MPSVKPVSQSMQYRVREQLLMFSNAHYRNPAGADLRIAHHHCQSSQSGVFLDAPSALPAYDLHPGMPIRSTAGAARRNRSGDLLPAHAHLRIGWLREDDAALRLSVTFADSTHYGPTSIRYARAQNQTHALSRSDETLLINYLGARRDGPPRRCAGRCVRRTG
jgi:hypothetical protein